MTAIAQDGKTYVPLSFLSAIYGEERADGLSDIILHEGEEYAALNDVCGQENRILSSIKDGIAIVSYKEQLFNPVVDAKLTALLDQGLSDGRYPERPEYEIRFDYTPPAQTPKPADDALISVGSSTSGAVSASREIGPSTDEEVTLSFDMISVLSPNQTNAIVGIGSSDSAYTAYSQVPIIIRMRRMKSTGWRSGSICMPERMMSLSPLLMVRRHRSRMTLPSVLRRSSRMTSARSICSTMIRRRANTGWRISSSENG